MENNQCHTVVPMDHIDRILNAAPILSLVGEAAELSGGGLSKEAFVGMQMALMFVSKELQESCDALIPVIQAAKRPSSQQPVFLRTGEQP